MKLESVTLESLGVAKKIIIDKENTNDYSRGWS